MPVICTCSSDDSSMPVGMRSACMRSAIMNTALQTIAQVRAICSTISAEAVLCRRRLEKTGRISIVNSVVWTSSRAPSAGEGKPLLGLELDGGGDLHGAPRRQQAGEQAGGQGEDEGEQQHRRVEVRQFGI